MDLFYERTNEMNTEPKSEEFITAPAVFAVEDRYQIMVPVKSEMLFWVEVGGEKYFDHSNGVIRSDTRIHRVSVPAKVLDAAGEYTVCFKKIINRKPYYTETEETKTQTYDFYPVRTGGVINIYHIADAHGDFSFSSKAGKYFGDDIDLLILNGDIIDHNSDVKNFEIIFKLCEAITGGKHPCVFSRGNHDLRGSCAEKMVDYYPNSNGKSYYTFRLGRIWGIVLDCGEDKSDSNEEYGGTVCFSGFRKEETEFLKKVAKDGEYLDKDIEYKLIIVHNPFTYTLASPFDIEKELFKSWADILKDKIKPDAIIAGHLHRTCVSKIGGELDSKGQPCPVIVGSCSVRGQNNVVTDFIGCALTIDGGKTDVMFTDSEHNVLSRETL